MPTPIVPFPRIRSSQPVTDPHTYSPGIPYKNHMVFLRPGYVTLRDPARHLSPTLFVIMIMSPNELRARLECDFWLVYEALFRRSWHQPTSRAFLIPTSPSGNPEIGASSTFFHFQPSALPTLRYILTSWRHQLSNVLKSSLHLDLLCN